MPIRRPWDKPAPPSGRVDRVRMLEWPGHLRPHCYQVGTIEGTVGDEVLVRFGEVVVLVPAEMLESADD